MNTKNIRSNEKKAQNTKHNHETFCRYRRVRNSDRILDAHDYGHKVWHFLG